ncbi:FAD-dependent monooxygenase [Streptomyces agglomeratus]|uniref:FAD-dependent monooxygenase n=1 Tax=Streptomyces agglomeratus TaxID=285458 RepID=UPI00085484B4|nr:FAD-dependent monooxygenase [Streptomyces agglomeratus]OEJ36253.1 FAD-dependent oxidoreductase [Streptomyces agglomeratus]
MRETPREPQRIRTVLISGASIAGPSLAFWLSRYGYTVTVVEKAPALRGGGFAVDFRGDAHRTVLQRMGIWDEIHRQQTHMGVQTFVDTNGTEQVTLPADFMSGEVEIFRGDLSRILYERTRHNVEYVFGDSIAALDDTEDEVRVTFERSAPRSFDVVVGADGLHSNVRRLAFGDESQFLRHLGYYVAGFDVPNHLGLDRTAQWLNAPGRAVSLSHYGGDPAKAGVSMVFESEELTYDRRDTAQHKQILTERYAGLGWEVPTVLEGLDTTQDLYFDAIAQVHMERYSKGRVVLLGDAGYGATMGGMGTGLAVVCAYVLAGEIATHGDHRAAFAGYEAEIREFAKGCQKTAKGAGGFLAPPSEQKIRSRNRTYRMLTSRFLSGFFSKMTTKTAENIRLKDYPAAVVRSVVASTVASGTVTAA